MRKERAKPGIILPDPKFNDVIVAKFINNIMRKGKKNVACKIFYDAIDLVSEKIKTESGLEAFKKALENVTPQVEVRSRRIGGATYQIPNELTPQRKISLAMKNIISAAKKRNEKGMANKLAAEIIAAYKNEGGAFKKKEDMHRMAEANKAFSHFRF